VVKVTVTGATGMIGAALVEALLARGDEVTVLSRSAGRAEKRFAGRAEAHEWRDPRSEPAPPAALAGRDAVVHLLGERLDQRWTDAARREIRDSRVLGTRNLVGGLAALDAGERPGLLVSQSAVGYYGPHADERVTEDSPPGDDFVARVCVEWEREARAAEALGSRVVTTRTGVVLSQASGALEKMLPPFKLGVGGPVAGGRQFIPWIHLDDVAGGLVACLDAADVAGPVNLTAPEPVANRDFSATLGRVLRRPALLPVPAFALKLLYGDMAEIVVTGVRAVPERLRALGYDFRQPELEPALRDATGRG